MRFHNEGDRLPEIPKTDAELLDALAALVGGTQKDVATWFGVDPSQVTRWRTSMPRHVKRTIRLALGLDPPLKRDPSAEMSVSRDDIQARQAGQETSHPASGLLQNADPSARAGEDTPDMDAEGLRVLLTLSEQNPAVFRALVFAASETLRSMRRTPTVVRLPQRPDTD